MICFYRSDKYVSLRVSPQRAALFYLKRLSMRIGWQAASLPYELAMRIGWQAASLPYKLAMSLGGAHFATKQSPYFRNLLVEAVITPKQRGLPRRWKNTSGS
jgi:hypothetical protein